MSLMTLGSKDQVLIKDLVDIGALQLEWIFMMLDYSSRLKVPMSLVRDDFQLAKLVKIRGEP